MNIKIKRLPLAKALRIASSVTSKSSPSPILRTVKLELIDGGRLHITASDGAAFSTSTVDAQESDFTRGDGACLPTSLLAGFVDKSTEDFISISVEGDKAAVKSGNSRCQMPAFSTHDFPDSASASGYETMPISVPASELKEAIAATKFCARRTKTDICSGLLLRADVMEGELVMEMVGTDTTRASRYHLAGASTTFDYKGYEGYKAVIPIHNIGHLSALLEESETVQVSATYRLPDDKEPSSIIFNGESSDLVLPLLAGSYPPYETVWPKESEWEVTVNRDELRAAVDRLLLHRTEGDEMSEKVMFGVSSLNDAVEMKCTSGHGSTANEEIEGIVEFRDGRVHNSFAARTTYWKDIANAFDKGELRIRGMGPLQPIIVEQIVDGKLGAFAHLAMPTTA